MVKGSMDCNGEKKTEAKKRCCVGNRSSNSMPEIFIFEENQTFC